MKKSGGKPRKGITLDGLARMTADWFVGVKKELSDTKTELSEKIDKEVGGLRKEMKVEFAEVNTRFNRMGLFSTHDRRLDKLESDSQVIKTILEQKLEVTFRNR